MLYSDCESSYTIVFFKSNQSLAFSSSYVLTVPGTPYKLIPAHCFIDVDRSIGQMKEPRVENGLKV